MKKYLFLLILISSCKNDNSIYNTQYYKTLDSLKSELFYNRDSNSYFQYQYYNRLIDTKETGFFYSQKMCDKNNAVGCYNCYSFLNSIIYGNKDKYKSIDDYYSDSLLMTYYLIKSKELGATTAISIVQSRFGDSKITSRKIWEEFELMRKHEIK